MVKGVARFREHFRDHTDAYVVIGGVACDEWFALQGMSFRATRDIDIVLIVEALTPNFVRAFWEFIQKGEYEIRERTEGDPILYRFEKPKVSDYPYKLELFSRKPELVDLAEGQKILPIRMTHVSSLSAILMDENYYRLLLDYRRESGGFPWVDVNGLIPLKARAYLDFNQRRAGGERVDRREIAKHRNDVFRLTATLPDEEGPDLPDSIKEDLWKFISEFPADSGQWSAIRGALKDTLGGRVPAADLLLATLMKYFRLNGKT